MDWGILAIKKGGVKRLKPKFLAPSTEEVLIPFTTIVNTGEGVSWG